MGNVPSGDLGVGDGMEWNYGCYTCDGHDGY